MANVNVAAYKILGDGWSNEIKYIKLVYDFALDGGATTDVYRLALCNKKMLVMNAVVQVETTATSGGAATVKIGATTADDDAFLTVADGAVASLVDDATFVEAPGQKLVIASGDYIALVVGTAALTAGKLSVHLHYVNAV